ncbi:MAG: Mor transcription activator family protein [Burkholderiaceae bacterium]
MTEVVDDAALQALPAQLRKIAEVVGYTPALKLARHFGGVRLYVPAVMTPEHLLARLIGFEAAHRLAREYGGQMHFDIPRAQGPALKLMVEERNAAIREKKRMGKSMRDLAMEYALSERWILKIVQDDDTSDDTGQPDLFMGTTERTT